MGIKNESPYGLCDNEFCDAYGQRKVRVEDGSGQVQIICTSCTDPSTGRAIVESSSQPRKKLSKAEVMKLLQEEKEQMETKQTALTQTAVPTQKVQVNTPQVSIDVNLEELAGKTQKQISGMLLSMLDGAIDNFDPAGLTFKVVRQIGQIQDTVRAQEAGK
jgi:hypothetical protein